MQHHISSGLFRPPYGKVTLKQIRSLRSQWQIIMWDVLSYDFETNVSPAKCIQNVMQHVHPRSIIVFTIAKGIKNLSETLPVVLEKLSKGYSLTYASLPATFTIQISFGGWLSIMLSNFCYLLLFFKHFEISYQNFLSAPKLVIKS